MRMIRKGLALLALTTATVSCGAAQLQKHRVEDVTGVTRAALEVGAEDVPQAALHLHLAEQQLEEYEALTAEDEHEKAQRTLQRAQLDADLALQLAQTERQQVAARAAREKVRELKSESN